jgi:hypothetical protein
VTLAKAAPRILLGRLLAELDFHIDAGGQIELHQRVDSLRGGINNIEKALVGAHLELFTALLSTWGERFTVNFSKRVGNGIGPRMAAPVRFAVSAISPVAISSTR